MNSLLAVLFALRTATDSGKGEKERERVREGDEEGKRESERPGMSERRKGERAEQRE